MRIQRNLKILSDMSEADGKKKEHCNFKPVFVVQWSQTGSGLFHQGVRVLQTQFYILC